jgi:GNAT superfamily N-acetyltransferase
MNDVEVSCTPLLRQNLPDLETFFTRDAFTNNPFAARCFCAFHYLDDPTDVWQQRDAEANRALRRRLLNAGQAHGILAYYEETVVGWVGVDMRPALRRYDQWNTPSASDVGIIHCFVVQPALRRRGIARQLLAAACSHLADLGARQIEAYVVRHPEAAETAVEQDRLAYHGPLPLYLERGFEIVGDASDQAFYTRVRLTLVPRPKTSRTGRNP